LSVTIAIALVLIGLLAGTLGSLVGLGGGFLIVPLLSLLFTLPSREVAGTSTAVVLVTAASSTLAYLRLKRIDLKSGWLFAVVSIPGAFIGADFSHMMPTHDFDLSFGIFLIIVSVFLLLRPDNDSRQVIRGHSRRVLEDAQGNHYDYAFFLPIGLIAGFFVGFLSSLFGIGGGTVMVPVMVLLLGFPAAIATATSMFMILVSSVIGTASHAILGDIRWLDAVALAIGAFLGGRIGPLIARRLTGKWLLRTLAVVMIATAARMIWTA